MHLPRLTLVFKSIFHLLLVPGLSISAKDCNNFIDNKHVRCGGYPMQICHRTARMLKHVLTVLIILTAASGDNSSKKRGWPKKSCSPAC